MGRSIALAIVGFGGVGRAFARLLLEKKSLVEKAAGSEVHVAFIADSRGLVGSHEGLDWGLVERALAAPRGSVSMLPGGRPGASVYEAIDEMRPDILVDATPSIYQGDLPKVKRGWYEAVLGYGGFVVTASKDVLALWCGELSGGGWGLRLLYKASIMAGTPLADMLRWGFKGRDVRLLRGVLNGTTNFVLGLVERGYRLDEAVEEAVARGYAEPDPSADLKGLDLAAKASIATCSLEAHVPLYSVRIESVVDSSVEGMVASALSRGLRVKYVAEAGRGWARVRLVEVPQGDPLYSVDGPGNAVVVETGEGVIEVRGPGAGYEAAASALFSDVMIAAELLGVGLP